MNEQKITINLDARKFCACPPKPMSTIPRDTQFKGFAEKLYQEIEDLTCSFSVLPSADEMKRLECEIYARRAYDLAQHALSNEKLHWYPLEEISVSDIPDLTELPEEQKA